MDSVMITMNLFTLCKATDCFQQEKEKELETMWPCGFCSQSTLGFKLETLNKEPVLWKKAVQ